MKKNLVVIDDERAIRSILERQLGLYGFNVHCCESGEEGLKFIQSLVKTRKIDVILLDWMMPEMLGLEVLATLKDNHETRDIPVFMLTSKSKVNEIDEAFDMGADDFIVKPFRVKLIGSTIDLKLFKLQEKKQKLAGVK
jgi:DNA-binding response OmpR family regulator